MSVTIKAIGGYASNFGLDLCANWITGLILAIDYLKLIKNESKYMSLWSKVFIGMCLGIISGIIFGKNAAIFQPLGTIFINLILMLVIPLIFFVLMNGIVNIQDTINIRRIGIKSVVLFIMTAMVAVVLGIIVTTILKPGSGVNFHLLSNVNTTPTIEKNNLMHILLSIVPSNALKSMVEGNILHVILLAFFIGITLATKRDSFSGLIQFINEMSQLMIKMIETIVKIAPFGVFGYMSWAIGTQGLDILLPLVKLIFTIFFGCALQYLLFGVIILVFAKLSPLPFYRKMVGPQLLAFSTSCSKATLTTLMKTAHEKLGMSKTNTNLLIPLASVLNMDGGALYLSSCVLFFAQSMGVTLGISDYIIIIITCTLGSIGAAGIPSGILLFLGMALTAVGLPIEAVAIIAGIDRILDMVTTMINVTGDACIPLVIDKTEGTLDVAKYNSLQCIPEVIRDNSKEAYTF
jgi:Na+/H+-dicarboxylate symporter